MESGQAVVEGFFRALGPLLPWLIAIVALNTVATFPMPGRGPMSRRRDPWRGFKFAARQTVMNRAGGQCEAPELLVWGRCPNPAVEVDHVYPHSKGGPTVPSNGQALCRRHNRSKRNMTPPWWYVLGLERRRRSYFPKGVDERVFAVMTEADYRAREAWLRNRGPRY